MISIPSFSCFNQHGSGSYGKAHFLGCGGRQLFKLAGHVLGESSDGAAMPGDAELEEFQCVSPRNASREMQHGSACHSFNPLLYLGRL